MGLMALVFGRPMAVLDVLDYTTEGAWVSVHQNVTTLVPLTDLLIEGDQPLIRYTSRTFGEDGTETVRTFYAAPITVDDLA